MWKQMKMRDQTSTLLTADPELEVLLQLLLVMTVASDSTSVIVKDATEDNAAAEVGVGAKKTKAEGIVVISS